MTHKYLLIGLFLGLIVNTSYSQNSDELKNLRGELLKKELELSELGKKISEQETIFSSYGPKLMDLYEQAIEKRKDALHKESAYQDLTDQERSEITESLNKNLDDFFEKLKSLSDKNNKERFLVKELLKKEEVSSNSFDSFKFHIIKISIEFALLSSFIEQYEDSLREFACITDQIEALEKTTSTN